MKIKIIAVLVGSLALLTSVIKAEDKVTIRFGHFPNVTHAQGVVALPCPDKARAGSNPGSARV